MAGAKLVVIYPRPLDEAAFETEYQNTHLPMVEQKLKGINRMVMTKILSSPQGETRSYRMAELHFSSMDALNECLKSDGAKAVTEHATEISTGGRPILMIAEEETRVFW